MIDTHTHLYLRDDFPDGGSDAVRRALDAGISHMVLPNVGLTSMEDLLRLHALHPDVTSIGVGLHPEEIDADWRPRLEDVFARFADEAPVAVGEVGIDLYHDPTYRFQQMDAFGDQLDRAYTMGLPVIIHCREALDDTLDVIRMMGDRRPERLVFHSFTGNPADARRILALPGTYLGINGVVTFKNAPELREAVAEAGAGRLVLETDSPYLAPVPKRGRTNESAYIPYIRDRIAEVCGLPPEEVEAVTDANARSIFNLSSS